MGVRAISVDVLAGWLQSAEPPRLIDVLSAAHFERAHLPGAESIPRAELRARAPRQIDVYDFEGGLGEWRRHGLPLAPPSRSARAA